MAYWSVNQNEDGTYSWKFDDLTPVLAPNEITPTDMSLIWQSITCPTLLVAGSESWAPNPNACLIQHFRTAEVATFEGAGHWVHLEQPDRFAAVAEKFLGRPTLN
jgi:pimeloyl-ACP methyl ester carboxylesterase